MIYITLASMLLRRLLNIGSDDLHNTSVYAIKEVVAYEKSTHQQDWEQILFSFLDRGIEHRAWSVVSSMHESNPRLGTTSLLPEIFWSAEETRNK